MTEDASSLKKLLSASDALYAIQEPGRPVTLHSGGVSASGKESIHYRKFFLPRKKNPSLWCDFPDSATLSFSNINTYETRQLSKLPPLTRPKNFPVSDRPAWNQLCEKAAAAIQRESAFKLVTSRKISISLSTEEKELIAQGVFHRLFFPSLESSFRFFLKSGASLFFGASPELLFYRENGEILVPAIAGTRALDPGYPESSLREELLGSIKDRAEHEWVVRGIHEVLFSLGLTPIYPAEPQILRTSRLLHLYTPITMKDSAKISGKNLLETLHPTPAIGGQPKIAAMDFLFENEDWDRGLFSSPMLFSYPDRELCLVAIRSALLTSNELHFFAGAGYVKGSTPESEWLETERKMQVMQSLLFGDAYGT